MSCAVLVSSVVWLCRRAISSWYMLASSLVSGRREFGGEFVQALIG
jgi:hypothetical protein